MFRWRWPLGLLMWTACASLVGDALAVPAPPSPLTVTQPDGTRITLTLLGDETNLRAEDARGYSALGVATDGGTEWRYAVPGPAGLAPSPLVVGRDDPTLLGLAPHLGWPAEVVARRAARANLEPLPGSPPWWLRPRADTDAAGPRRHQRPLVVLVSFTGGHPAGMPTHRYTPAQFGALFFARGLDPIAAGLPASYTSSVADYFDEVSRGQWTFIADEADVVGWVSVPRDYGWYVAGAQGMGPDPRNTDTLLVEVASEIDDVVDFSAHDLDLDGRVDDVILVVEGWGDGSLDQFWPFTSRAPPGLLYDGVELSTYVVVPEQLAFAQPEYGLVRGDIHPIGTLCHELGHALGLPELGDPDGSSSGVGDWSLMGTGAWRAPNHPTALDAWSRMMLGWELPIELDSGPLSLRAFGGGGEAARIWIDPYRDAEFFLLENRQPTGTDRHLPGGGLLIWHIDEARRATLVFRDLNTDERRAAVALEQADGRNELRLGDGTGDAGDPFPGQTRKRDFGVATTPDSRSNEGFDSGVRVLGISDPADVMNANVTAPERWGYRLGYDRDATRSAGLGDNFIAVRFTAPPAGDGIAYALIVWADEAGVTYEASLRQRNVNDRPGRVLWSTSGVLPEVGWNRVPITTAHLPLSAGGSIFGVVRYGDDDIAPIRLDEGPAEAERSLISANGTFWQIAPGNIALRLLVDQCPDFDGDGVRICKGDCDDRRATTNPEALEICNGIDDDCGGDVDEGFDDLDGDGLADCVDPDDDDDGVVDEADVAPRDEARCQDEDGDGCDDCRLARTPPRPDADGDDLDGDGLCDGGDEDVDGDGVGDEEDPAPRDARRCGDVDADGCDDCALIGRFDPLADGPDADADGTCDASDDDDDGDGVGDADDPAPTDAHRCADADTDGCDDCAVTAGPADPADDGVDTDHDGTCDLGDDDDDGDGVGDAADGAPIDRLRCADADADGCDDCALDGAPSPSRDGLDTDGDGACDAGDADDDGDGVADDVDGAALDPTRCADADADGCDDCAMQRGAPDPNGDGSDTDEDGTCDASDEDDDGDGAVDVADRDPLDAFVCGDWDGDECDDCSVTGGPPDGEHDGTDIDRDGICDAFDSDVPRDDPPTPLVEGGCGAGAGDGPPWLLLGLSGLVPWRRRSAPAIRHARR